MSWIFDLISHLRDNTGLKENRKYQFSVALISNNHNITLIWIEFDVEAHTVLLNNAVIVG